MHRKSSPQQIKETNQPQHVRFYRKCYLLSSTSFASTTRKDPKWPPGFLSALLLLNPIAHRRHVQPFVHARHLLKLPLDPQIMDPPVWPRSGVVTQIKLREIPCVA